MSTSFQLLLPRAIREQMVAHARTELPNECCGLLAAAPRARRSAETDTNDNPQISRIERCYALVNAVASSTLYESEPKSMFAAWRDIQQHSLDIVAIYHSHPTSPPIPSKTDRERNYSEDVINFIISLQHDEPEIRAWWLTAAEAREASWQLIN